ncbi:polysaccharide deacetylase [Patiriisocius marinistellae]|uniref:Polysaccharide deacetylase n=1 Tax=Patiriisocius marinistellae TaxID=2494560 RepID=A0A5J4FU11_9FLAO|nr:polysaccharide deacetylase family protein [Patiriisocius marinistellae]GEQ85213.1 polysaccharide deacetylase [Patiriisocius marinistellae]
MNSLLVSPPKLIQRLFSTREWSRPNNEKTIYLTFDDGPIPIITPWVLETLYKFNAKATFFCIGDNVNKHPSIFAEILNNGHSVGNHTQHHLNGWKTNFKNYIKDVELFENTFTRTIKLNENNYQKTTICNLYRPPYGKMTSRQAKKIREKGYKIIMWNVLSMDYDANISEEKCLENVLKNISNGSIIVFHDSLKAEKNLRYALPKVLSFIVENNYRFSKL